MENIHVFLLICLITLIVIYLMSNNENFKIIINNDESNVKTINIDGQCNQCTVTTSTVFEDKTARNVVCPSNCQNKTLCLIQGYEGEFCS